MPACSIPRAACGVFAVAVRPGRRRRASAGEDDGETVIGQEKTRPGAGGPGRDGFVGGAERVDRAAAGFSQSSLRAQLRNSGRETDRRLAWKRTGQWRWSIGR